MNHFHALIHHDRLPRGVRFSLSALVLSNLIPLAGVVLFDWSVYFIMVLFWIENIIIGLFNILKMLTAKGGINGLGEGIPTAQLSFVFSAAKVFLIPFFTIHYGGFALVHGFFVLLLFRPGGFFGGPASASTSLSVSQISVPAAALFISHGLSFVLNYLYGGERNRTNVVQLMTEPYKRVVVLHLAIVIGAILVLYTGSATPALVVLILLKIVLDIKAHLRQHLGPPRPVILTG